MLQPSVHARTRPLNPLRHAGLLPGSRRRRARSPRPAAAIGSAEAQATAASSERPGPTLLDYPVALLAPLDGCPRDCQIQDRRRLASGCFRLYWRWRSRPRGGRPKITEEIRALIRQMAEENAGWGAPK